MKKTCSVVLVSVLSAPGGIGTDVEPSAESTVAPVAADGNTSIQQLKKNASLARPAENAHP
jgi:hypothetical protein